MLVKNMFISYGGGEMTARLIFNKDVTKTAENAPNELITAMLGAFNCDDASENLRAKLEANSVIKFVKANSCVIEVADDMDRIAIYLVNRRNM